MPGRVDVVRSKYPKCVIAEQDPGHRPGLDRSVEAVDADGRSLPRHSIPFVTRPASRLFGVDERGFFAGERIRRVGQRRPNIVARETRIRVEVIGLGPTSLSFRTMSSTGIRVPRITGLPNITRRIRIVSEDLFACRAGSKKVEHILHADPEASRARRACSLPHIRME